MKTSASVVDRLSATCWPFVAVDGFGMGLKCSQEFCLLNKEVIQTFSFRKAKCKHNQSVVICIGDLQVRNASCFYLSCEFLARGDNCRKMEDDECVHVLVVVVVVPCSTVAVMRW